MPAVARIDPKDVFTPEEWARFSKRSSWLGLACVAGAWALIFAAGAVFYELYKERLTKGVALVMLAIMYVLIVRISTNYAVIGRDPVIASTAAFLFLALFWLLSTIERRSPVVDALTGTVKFTIRSRRAPAPSRSATASPPRSSGWMATGRCM